MELKIYNKSGNLILTASPNTSSSLTEEIGGECSVSASFTHTSFILLDVDSYIEIEGVRYKVKSRYRPKQKDTQTYEYSVKFYAPIHDAEDALMLFQEGGTTSEFSYDGGPREHLQLWIDNMNRRAGGNLWSIGTVISAENKTIEYKNLKCWDAAFGSNGIAATFETEMWADGYVINLCKAERGEIVELGYLQGLTNLAQEDNGEVKFFTRLFPLGSTKNIDASKYGYSRLQLPSRAMYVDKNVDLYGVKEETEEAAFSEIYPQYVGTVSSVRTEEKTNEEGREYTVYYFKDDGMNWNPKDYEIPDLDYMLQFQTGELVGRGTDGSFQAAWHEDTREWEIINVYPNDTTQIPGDVIIPKPGDTYIPWNFSMPQEYVTAAEQAYEQAVNNFLSSYSFDPNKYTGTTDRNYIERNATPLRIGWNVRLLSEQYFSTTGGYKDTRITKVQRKLNDLCQATITCSDEIGTGWKSSVDNRLSNLQYVLSQKQEQEIIDIIKTTDSKTPSDWNVFSALRSLATFLRKDKADETKYLIKFFAGLEAGLYAEGGKDGSKLYSDGLAELGRLQVNGNSEFRGNLSSQEFISGFLTGKGWAIQMKKYLNAAGVEEYKAVGELDDLIVRGTLRVFEFVVSQLLGENDNRIFTAMLEVDHYDPVSGKVYLDTQEGKFYNPFRVDDCIMVQQYNGMPSEENNHYVTKQYELIVTEIGMEGDLAWVKFRNFTTSLEGGTPESLILRKDTFVRVDNLSDPDRKGIIQMMTVGSNTPYMDVAYGLKTDPDNALKVRIGKLEGIYNTLFGWLQSYGAYLVNLYAVGEYRQRNTGEDLDTKIEMLKEQFLTEYKKQYYDITDEENFLKNTAFQNDMEYWSVESDTQFITVSDNPLYVNRSLVAIKQGFVGIEEHEGKNMLRISNNGIRQLNVNIRQPGTHKEYNELTGKETEVRDTLYLSLKAQFVTSGTLKIGFPVNTGTLQYVEESVSAINPNSYTVMQWSGTWNGNGDFVLEYSGDMYVSLLSVTTKPLDNYRATVSTQFKQTESTIGLYGSKIDNLNQSVTSLGVEIDAANETISLHSTKISRLESTTTNLGLKIDAANERIDLYADKVDDIEGSVTNLGVRISAAESNITMYAQRITQNEQSIAQLEVSVDGISSTVISEIDGNTIVSKINQTATTVSIEASKINLNGAITANKTFKIDTDGTFSATAGKIGGFTISGGRLDWKSRDYFGNDSRSIKIGVSSTSTEGLVDINFNAATTGRFGVKVLGSNAGGACIYASRYSSGYTMPYSAHSYAAFFDGSVGCTQSIFTETCAATEFFAVTSYDNYGNAMGYKGVTFGYNDYDLDSVRFQVQNGLIVGVKHE